MNIHGLPTTKFDQPLPTAAFEIITPAKATEMLSYNNHNRLLKQRSISKYADMINDGNWIVTGQPIIFSKSGELLDGQHRLAAVIASGSAITSLVVRNVDDDENVMAVIDTGVPRSPGDVFQIRGIPNSNQVAAATRMVLAYERRTLTNLGNSTPDRITLLERYNETPELMQEAVHRTKNTKMPPKLAPMSLACFYVVTIADPKAGVFLDGVLTGSGIDATSPAYTVRAWGETQDRNKERRNKVTDLSALLRCWVAYSVGGRLGKIQPWKPNMDMEFNYLKKVSL